MSAEITIGGRVIGPGHPPYVIAELSANHRQDLGRAIELVRIAREVGADAVKLQTYTPETMTIDSDKPPFRIGEGTIWQGRRLFELYSEAQTPWDWHRPLRDEATRLGLECFSTPFDLSALAFLEDLDMHVYKIASFELVDIALIEAAAATGKPLIVSTGMANIEEIDEAVRVARTAGDGGVALLRCNSTYPAPPADMDLRTIVDMMARWNAPIGLSDHTLGTASSVAAVALGATIIEKHLTFARDEGGPDAAFSLEPNEFADLVRDIRDVHVALGGVRYGPTAKEHASLSFRRSLFVVEDVAEGGTFTERNVRSIRPADGLAPKCLPTVLGRRARRAIERGTPLTWDLVADQT
jgi:N-acetylneuraminate synthase